MKVGVVLVPPLEAAVFEPNRGFCPELALAVPKSDGDEVPLDAPPRFPNMLVLVFVPWLDPNGELEPKSPPVDAPVDAGVPKLNGLLLDIFAKRRFLFTR